jgi:hypothetical protein
MTRHTRAFLSVLALFVISNEAGAGCAKDDIKQCGTPPRQGTMECVNGEWTACSASSPGEVPHSAGDGIVWQHSDGTVHFWSIKNGQRQDGMNIGATGPVASEWKLIGAGDLNGDGTDDLLWQHSDGTVHYWLIKNGQRQGGMNIGATGPVGPEWRLIGAGHLKSAGALSIEFEQPGSAALPPKTSRTIKKIGADGSIIGVTRDPLVGVPEKMWEPGQTLRVRMTGGSAMVRSKVRQFAQEWTKYANIRFQFVDDASPAEIRISFQKGKGNWSSVGRDALGVPFDGPTMNFSDLSDDSTDDDYGYYVLHEFGHALGLIHEHQSPAAGIAWDKEKVYKFYKESQDPPWDKDKVDRNMFDRLSAASTNFSAYDRTSIMHYAYGSDLLLSGTGCLPTALCPITTSGTSLSGIRIQAQMSASSEQATTAIRSISKSSTVSSRRTKSRSPCSRASTWPHGSSWRSRSAGATTADCRSMKTQRTLECLVAGVFSRMPLIKPGRFDSTRPRPLGITPCWATAGMS